MNKAKSDPWRGNVIVKNWNDWINSDAGKACCDTSTLGPKSKQSKYLKNRLWHAFMEGAKHITIEVKHMPKASAKSKKGKK